MQDSDAANNQNGIPVNSRKNIQGGVILHCFNWSYRAIAEHLPEIAAAGYTAVQTSPVQPPKDYAPDYTDPSEQWWKLYQPLDLSIAGEKQSWLGSRDDLASLCDEAEQYGIGVIVDIVANHLANNGSDGGTFGSLSPYIAADLRQEVFYHDDPLHTDDASRYDITQRHLNMPDLNTGHEYVQKKVFDLLCACVDCGVDGFRFDAAKHIELEPETDGDFGSYFWRSVTDGVKQYAAETYGITDLFFYGEILGDAGTGIVNYTRYMAVTDNVTGDRTLAYALEKNCEGLHDYRYEKDAGAENSVLWVESHDTYESSSSIGIQTSTVSNDDLARAWAITGSRAGSTALYLARPAPTMGEAGDDAWSSAVIAEVNKFKDKFIGQSEYLWYSDEFCTAYNERGTGGVVISKLDGEGDVWLTANRMEDGIYTDHVSGGQFTVENGMIAGHVGETGVAVVYHGAN